MKKVVVRYRDKRNGKADPKAARKIVEEALAYKRTHPSPLDGLTFSQIMARIKKTRDEIFEDRLAAHFRQ